MTWRNRSRGKKQKGEDKKGLGGREDREAADIFHDFDLHRFHTYDLNSHSNSKEGVTTNNQCPWFTNFGSQSQRNERLLHDGTRKPAASPGGSTPDLHRSITARTGESLALQSLRSTTLTHRCGGQKYLGSSSGNPTYLLCNLEQAMKPGRPKLSHL